MVRYLRFWCKIYSSLKHEYFLALKERIVQCLSQGNSPAFYLIFIAVPYNYTFSVSYRIVRRIFCCLLLSKFYSSFACFPKKNIEKYSAIYIGGSGILDTLLPAHVTLPIGGKNASEFRQREAIHRSVLHKRLQIFFEGIRSEFEKKSRISIRASKVFSGEYIMMVIANSFHFLPRFFFAANCDENQSDCFLLSGNA